MDPYIEALADERAGYARSLVPSRVIAVDEELARHGWCVDAAGKLVEIDQTTRSVVKEPDAPVQPPREKRPLKAPERVVEE
jgi:hypothetical protein